jgi:hypothetical protein
MGKLNFKIIALTFIVGLAITLGFAYIMSMQLATALFPTIALMAGFIVTGFLIGFFSKGVTFVEPGIGSILISIVLFFLIPALNLRGFEGVWNSDWMIIFMNSILLTFVGAWLGEKFEDSSLNSEMLIKGNFDWGWMIAGTIMGITFSMILVNLLDLVLGHNPSGFVIPYFVALLVSGLVVGWKSPGYTVLEGGLSGFLTVTMVFNIARLTLITEEPIGEWYIILGILLAFVVSIIGSWIGEKIQSSREK